MSALRTNAIDKFIRQAILKIDQIVKFSMACRLYMNAARIFAEDGQQFLKSMPVPCHGLYQFSEKSIILYMLVDIFSRLRRQA